MSVRVVLVEDQPVVRAGFKALLDAQPDIEVVGEAASGSQALIVTREQRPDVVVMDIRMPDMDGMEATRWIRADSALEPTRVLVLTTFELDEYVLGALQASASGFLLKRGEPNDLLRAVRIIAGGESLLAPSVTRRLIAQYLTAPATPEPTLPEGYAEWTNRGREMLTVIAPGMTNAETAQAFHLSPLTVKAHISRILMKLGARDRVHSS